MLRVPTAANARQRAGTYQVLLWMVALGPGASLLPAEEDEAFNGLVRPILAENCFACHGPDDAQRQAELRLDTRDGATADRDGRQAVVPGRAAVSLLIERITHDNPARRMPPTDSGKQLTEAEVNILARWIERGANYEQHWSFLPIRRPRLPAVRQTVAVRSPVDHFVIHKLDEHGLAPAPPADRYTLVRRVYLDLLGIPPSPAEVAAFVGDQRPSAFERLLDRVLANPHYGERWGRHWLDQARYADSHGYTNDNERTMWPYRDWVIASINRDLPFDQFTIEQLAGDLLSGASVDQLVATGFHRNTLINSEGGTKADQFRDEQVKDRVDTTGTVWLGLTLGCAKCHSHKFDPISQREYYQLYAFFNSTADRNSIDPTIKAPSSLQRRRLNELTARDVALTRQLDDDPQRGARQQTWEAQLASSGQEQVDEPSRDEMWDIAKLDAESLTLHGATFERLANQSLLVGGPNVGNDEYSISTIPPTTTIRSVRLEVLAHDQLPQRGPGRAADGSFVLSEFWLDTADGRELRFSRADAEQARSGYEVARSIDGEPNSGWALPASDRETGPEVVTAWFVLPQDLTLDEGESLTFALQFHSTAASANLGCFRISTSSEKWTDSPTVAELARLVALGDARTSTQQQRLDAAFLRNDVKLAPLYRERQRLEDERDRLTNAFPSTMVLRELDQIPPTHVQIRGDFLRAGDPVLEDVPATLPPLEDRGGRRTRLDFATWLVQPDHPLTPRVRVNRIWMRLFGRGLVETENDFGIQGTLPTHPHLLDWLASEFVRQHWSTKRLLRLLLSTATYRQSSHVTQVAAVTDPQNRLLSRQSRLRVEGEVIRDLSLAAAGLLSTKIGGPSVFPPQPAGIYAFTQRKMEWRTSQGEDRFRRGMYTFFYRSAPYPMLTTFDTPTFNMTCTCRDRSNTPLQSLTMSNSTVMFEAAAGLAKRVLANAELTDDTARLNHAFRICFARPPSADELSRLSRYLASAERRSQHDRQMAWTATARLLMNLDEFITRE